MSQHRRRSTAAASPAGGRAARRSRQTRRQGRLSRLIRGDEGSSVIKRLGIVAGALFLLGIIGAVTAYAMTSIPKPNEQAVQQSSVLLYAGGKEEIVRFGDTNRFSVPLAQVPRKVRDAVLAAENRSFYSDNGVSPKGIARALWVNLRGGSLQGGSTITQQYVKNYYLEQDRTITRKLREALLAIKIDNELSKDQILENYLNTIYFGRGAYGIQAASKAYFHKDVKDLSISEGAVLASIIRAPGRYDPIERREAVEGRMRYVLNGMVQMGAITATEAADQTYPKVHPAQKTARMGGQNGYIRDLVKKELISRGIDEARIDAGGLRIETTLKKQAQEAAVRAVENEAPKGKGLRIGLAAVEPGTGKIIAMYGGKDYLSSEPHAQENTADIQVQPGSAMKPFTLAAALEQDIGLNSRFAGNSPFEFGANEKVENQGNQDYGERITLLRATERSVNTAFVDVATQLKGQGRAIADVAEQAGIPADRMEGNINARLTLGIASVSPLDMAGAYATFAAEGIHADRHIVEKVLRPDGGVVPLQRIKPKRVFDKDVTADLSYALQGVVKAPNGTGWRARALGRPAAGKTGTHEGSKGIEKVWFVGYTPQLAAAVDIFKGGGGNEPLQNIGGDEVSAGGKFPALIWTAFMKAALDDEPIEQFPKPANIGGKVPPYVPPVTAQPTRASTPTATATPTPTFTGPNPTKTKNPKPTLGCPPFCPPSPSPTPTETGPGPGGGGPGPAGG